MTAPDVSIVIAVYNRGPAIRETIGSCLMQEGLSLEILAVDDASTDATREVLAAYRGSVKVIALDSSHGNGTFARTVGLRAARGDYVKFLDHDDILEPGSLPTEVSLARTEGADIVMSPWGVVEMDANGRSRPETTSRYEPPTSDKVIEAMLGEGKTPFTAAALYRRGLISDMEWDAETALYDDFDFFCRAALNAKTIVRGKSLAYWWRLNNASIQAGIASDPLSYFKAEKTRCIVYKKIEDHIRQDGRLTPHRTQLLLARYYHGLRAFSRWDPAFCSDIVGRITRLGPGWVPPPSAEPSPAIRLAIRFFGLEGFLAFYLRLRQFMR